ncbi:MAG: response regulator transcription factor [Sphingosinicella sp.]|nr:response regulator transcription factor [Sphingosinicella sp.]
MRILIADDEPIARQKLEHACQCIPEAVLVAVAKSGTEALSLIREVKPDVAILDVQMPGCNGLGVVSALRPNEFHPEVIFVTAFEQHAIRAFELHAVDYLLKPVAFDRFRDALRRAKARMDARQADRRFSELQEVIAGLTAAANGSGVKQYERELWVRERTGVTRIPVESIDLFEAAGDYVLAHVGNVTHLLTESISALQARFDPQTLLRVHRSKIVNTERIRSIKRRGKRGLAVVLTSGIQVEVGPTYAVAVLQTVGAKRWR